MNAELVREAINKGAATGKSFLFGIDFEMKNGFFLEDPLTNPQILFCCNGIGNIPPYDMHNVSHTPELTVISSDRKAYLQKFEIIHRGLLRGDSFLTNLTERTPIRTNLSLEEIFFRSKARYKIWIPEKFVCFSPECFIRIADERIHTYPMKGTIDATLPDAEKQLLEDYKEMCEHYTIVDLLRNDLSMVSDHVRVERFRYVEHVQTLRGEILQTSSEVVGNLRPGWRKALGDLIFRLLPAGSISGAPKPATLQLIRNAEQQERGFYSGVFGYFDGEKLDTAVMIRYIEQEGEDLYFRSGGGITIHSDPEREYDEILEKIYLPIPPQA